MTLIELEDFDPAVAEDMAPDLLSRSEAETLASQSYEAGYKSGWDDAAAAEAEDQARIGLEFARNLKDLSFSYYEARAQIIQSMKPFLDEIVTLLAPKVAIDGLAAHILQEFETLIDDASGAPLELIVSPDARVALEQRLQGSQIPDIKIAEEPTLAEGQVYLRVGKLERHIDLNSVTEKLCEAVQSLYQLNERSLEYG